MKYTTLASFAIAVLVAACGPTREPAEKSQSDVSADNTPAQKNLSLGTAFLDKNKTAPGVITTASGLQYKVIEAGPADGIPPYPGQYVCVHYQGTFIDGEEFDSSYGRGVPAVFPSNRLIKGWIEALGLMRAGDEWQLYIPHDLAYGSNGTGSGTIGPNEALVFKINLIKLLDISEEKYNATYRVNPSLDCSLGI